VSYHAAWLNGGLKKVGVIADDSIATSASRILTMLPSTPQVESVYLDPTAGILAGLNDLPPDTEPLQLPLSNMTTTSDQSSAHSSLPTEKNAMRNIVDSITGTGTEHPPHTILIDQTTLDPTFAMSLAEKVQSETLGRALMLDAPVSGGGCCSSSVQGGADDRHNCSYKWEPYNHVWFTIGNRFWTCGTITATHGSGGGCDILRKEWNWCGS
jgi:hypothetical protein